MTYLEYLLLFIILPSMVILALTIRLNKTQLHPLSLRYVLISYILLSIIALVYTTPWDNYLVANNIWFYDPSKILGIIFGYVPFEEYSFFILETVFVCLVVTLAFQMNFIRMPSTFSITFPKEKIVSLFFLTVIWLICFVSFINDIETMLYLNLLLLWGIPPIFFQILIGWDILIYNLKPIFTIIAILGTYLSLTDAYAIFNGIWTINSSYTIGIVLLIIPFEEILFFFMTVILILFGNILFSYFIDHYDIFSTKKSKLIESNSI